MAVMVDQILNSDGTDAFSNNGKGAIGWQKLPGGLLIQWCMGGQAGSETTYSVTWPMAFTTVYRCYVMTDNKYLDTRDSMFQLNGDPTTTGCSYFQNGMGGAGGWQQPFFVIIGV